MRILYLITKSEFGGAQTHVADLCRYFFAQGHQVTVMSRAGGWLENECRHIGVTFVDNKYFSNHISPVSLYQGVRAVQACVRQYKPDIVHCHSSAAAFFGRVAIRKNIRTIYTAHGWGFNVGIKPWIAYPVLWLEKLCARYTDTYICVSDSVKQLGLRCALAPESKFHVVYNGVKVLEQQSRIKSNDDVIHILFVGRLAEPKKPELLLQVIASLPKEVQKKISCTIVGDGLKRKKLEIMAMDIEVPVVFTGSLLSVDVLHQMSQADIFVFLSVWEGLPYVVLEAMSRGLPVIASGVGGVKEMVSSQSGIIVNNTTNQIYDALMYMIQNDEVRVRMGKEGKAQIERTFSLKIMCEKVENIYSQNFS